MLTAFFSILLLIQVGGNTKIPCDYICATESTQSCKETYKGHNNVWRTEKAICFTARTDSIALGRLRSLNIKNGDVIVLGSNGGPVKTAITMGELLSNQEVTAIVSKKCVSACANFLFLAAKYKIILDDAFVGFHKGPLTYSEAWDLAYEIGAKNDHSPVQVRNNFYDNVRISAAFYEFYKVRGLDMRITTEKPTRPDSFRRSGEAEFWTWSKGEFQKFGVKEIYFM